MPADKTTEVPSRDKVERLPLLLSYSVDPVTAGLLCEIIVKQISWPTLHSCFHDEDDLRLGGGKDLHPKRANHGVDHDAHDFLKRHVTSLGIGIGDQYHSPSLRLWNGRRCLAGERFWAL
jgi:hypothetical protein